MTPKRIQRKRTKGWRKPEGCVIVDRTSRYGNPWRVRSVKGYSRSVWFVERVGSFVDGKCFTSEEEAREYAVARFRDHAPTLDLEPLRGKDLACTCDPDDGMACHSDVLIELANR